MWQNVKAWFADPFDPDMSVTEWFLLVGLLIVASIMWKLILRHILEGLSS